MVTKTCFSFKYRIDYPQFSPNKVKIKVIFLEKPSRLRVDKKWGVDKETNHLLGFVVLFFFGEEADKIFEKENILIYIFKKNHLNRPIRKKPNQKKRERSELLKKGEKYRKKSRTQFIKQPSDHNGSSKRQCGRTEEENKKKKKHKKKIWNHQLSLTSTEADQPVKIEKPKPSQTHSD